MKDLPVFATENGVASLGLKQIPYNGSAYITLHDSMQPEALLKECCDFCMAVGAKNIFATGNSLVGKYPMHTEIISLHCSKSNMVPTCAVLLPMQLDSIERFRGIYNDVMMGIDHASYMSGKDAELILAEERGYFVYLDTTLIGIGVVAGNRIDAVISLVPGCGKEVLSALSTKLYGDDIEVEVVSSNTRAMRFYNKLGFRKVAEISQWYKIY